MTGGKALRCKCRWSCFLPVYGRKILRNKPACWERQLFEVTFPGAYGQREVRLMDLATKIALAALVVEVIGTVFDIVWSVYIERKHNKKEK